MDQVLGEMMTTTIVCGYYSTKIICLYQCFPFLTKSTGVFYTSHLKLTVTLYTNVYDECDYALIINKQ